MSGIPPGDEEGLATLIMDCRYLLGRFTRIRLVHTFLEGNKCADFMANLGQTGD